MQRRKFLGMLGFAPASGLIFFSGTHTTEVWEETSVPRGDVLDWSQCCICRPGDAPGHLCYTHAQAIDPVIQKVAEELGHRAGMTMRDTWMITFDA